MIPVIRHGLGRYNQGPDDRYIRLWSHSVSSISSVSFEHVFATFVLNLLLVMAKNKDLEGGGGVDATPPKVLLGFFLGDKTSAPDVSSSCSFIPRTHFETSSVTVSFYGYQV